MNLSKICLVEEYELVHGLKSISMVVLLCLKFALKCGIE